MLVQFEQEIDALEQKIKRAEGRRNSQGSVTDVGTAHSDTDSDRASLDEWVSGYKEPYSVLQIASSDQTVWG